MYQLAESRSTEFRETEGMLPDSSHILEKKACLHVYVA